MGNLAVIKLANEMVYYSNIHIWQTFNNLVLITLSFMWWTNLKELFIKPEPPPYTTSSWFLNRLSLKKMQILLCIWATALKWNLFAILKVTFSFKIEGSVGNISIIDEKPVGNSSAEDLLVCCLQTSSDFQAIYWDLCRSFSLVAISLPVVGPSLF